MRNFSTSTSRGWLLLHRRAHFYFDGNYTSIPYQADRLDGPCAIFDLRRMNATVPNGVDMVGGMDQIYASNFGTVHANRNYFGVYFQDDWAIRRS